MGYPGTCQPPFADLRPRMWDPPFDKEVLQEIVENQLCDCVRAHREAMGLPTIFDGHLGQLLHVALVNCELDRVGSPCHAHVFENLLRRICSADEVFRAVPVQFNHLRVSLFWSTLSSHIVVRELLSAPPSSFFALRIHLVSYPENATAVWVSLGVRGAI